SFEVAGGVQGALGEVWRVGFAGAYEQSFLETTTNASSDADRIHGGAVLKYNPGALLLAGAVSGGWGWYDTERPIAFPGCMALAQSEHEVGYVNGRLRAEYLLSAGTWYAKPMVDFDATHISLDSVREKGASGVGLNVRGSDETVLSASPMLELGAQFGNPQGTLVRPYLRGGATFYDDPDFVLLASFEGAPGEVGPFRIASATDDVLANIGAGVDVIGVEGASFRLYYEGRFGDLVEQHAGGIKATLPF
ncbi:MAG: autotransporter outer membrane beta-barrel domain-containing protein, partial [Burkholderiales bacterium]